MRHTVGGQTRAAIVVFVVSGLAIAGCWAVAPVRADAATTSPSAIGNLLPVSIAVSPDYTRSGLVVVSASQVNGCSSNCGELWLSRDRGDSWTRVDHGGFTGSHLAVAVDAAGHPVIFAASSSGVERSGDLGATWTQVGGSGTETVSPGYAHDATVAVAGKPDYVLHGGTSQTVPGSNGTMADVSWAIAAGFPSTGTRPPVLLGGLNGSIPTVQHCTSSFSCSGGAPLPAPDAFAGAANLTMSPAYAQDGTVFAQTADGVYKSTDAGTSFAPLTLPTAGASHLGVASLVTSPGYAESGPDRHVDVAALMIYGSGKSMTQRGAIFASADGGSTWSALDPGSPLDHGALSVAVAPDGRVFAGYFGQYGAGLLCNPDGTTWRPDCAAGRASAGSAQTGHGASASTGCASAACATPAAAATNGLPDTGGTQPLAGTAAKVPHRLAGATGGSGGGGVRWIVAAAIALLVVFAGGAVALVRRRNAQPPASAHTRE